MGLCHSFHCYFFPSLYCLKFHFLNLFSDFLCGVKYYSVKGKSPSYWWMNHWRTGKEDFISRIWSARSLAISCVPLPWGWAASPWSDPTIILCVFVEMDFLAGRCYTTSFPLLGLHFITLESTQILCIHLNGHKLPRPGSQNATKSLLFSRKSLFTLCHRKVPIGTGAIFMWAWR